MHYATVYLAVVMIKGMLIICVQTRCICEQIHLNSLLMQVLQGHEFQLK